MNTKRLSVSLAAAGLLALSPFVTTEAQTKDAPTLKQAMERLQDGKHVNFVYDSSLVLDFPYNGASPDSLPLREALDALFRETGITWKIKGNYVMLHKEIKRFTLNGYVYQPNGETLIQATLMDKESEKGTLTNAYGYYSFTLPEGKHTIRVSYVGYRDTLLTVDLTGNQTVNIYLADLPLLEEVVVTGDLNSPLMTTQTGKITLEQDELKTEFALMSSPDLIKSLQKLPGVTSGTELISGLYVHGGSNDGNLFLLDGNPIYQVNHLGGLFSAFNTDIVKTVDFYKSGFPARYGGRLSSVVDVRTNDGDMKEFHGSFSLGLLDGRFQLEGPLVKDKTSFNLAVRRSWADLFTAAAFGIYNLSQTSDRTNGRYAFHDIHAKLAHRHSDKSRFFLSFYSGEDLMKIVSETTGTILNMPDADREDWKSKFKLRWGNLTASGNWNYVFSPRLFSNLTLVYSRNRSMYENYDDDRYSLEGVPASSTRKNDRSRSFIDDIGYRMEFDYRLPEAHHIRFGSNYLHHSFRPQNTYVKNFRENSETKPDTLQSRTSHFYAGNEFTLYAEDEFSLSSAWKVNLGVHYTLFNIQGKNYHSAEPRLATLVRLNNNLSAKLSYTEMSQFVHQLSNTYLNLPTDYWVPSTPRIRPMHSRQVAAGLYARLPFRVQIAAEGYYKSMRRLLEYDNGSSLTPSAENWEDQVLTGRGRAYGFELSGSYKGSKTRLELVYTLSWSERKFDAFNRGRWYSDHFDNRHKIHLTVRHAFNKRIEGYAAWTFHTGDRATVATQQVEGPVVPGVNDESEAQWVYETPNNITMPNYHRLDVGINFRRITRRGHERIWNVSLYNAYCRMNPLFAEVEYKGKGKYLGKATGVFPIIPSFSYTLKF